MSKPILNIDLDGVIYPFIDVFRRYLTEKKAYGTLTFIDQITFREFGGTPPVPTQWNAWEDWGMPKEQWMSEFRRGVNDGFIWSDGEPIEGAVDGMWQLDDAGYFLRIVTNRLVLKASHRETLFATAMWLDKFNIPYHSLCMLGGESKATLTGVGLLDDKPENVDEYKWAPAYLFSQPWNAGYEGEATIVDGWGQAVVELEGLR